MNINSHCLCHRNDTLQYLDHYMCWMYLCRMVDICLCCNQTFHYQKVSILTSNTQGCPPILEEEEENISVIISTQQHTPMHVAIHITMRAEKCVVVQLLTIQLHTVKEISTFSRPALPKTCHTVIISSWHANI